MLLIHGWPDSFYRFAKLIPLLTQPDSNELAFDVTVPSIPGFGFSDRPSKTGVNRMQTGHLFHILMTETLNYSKYFVQGGDWGASIAQQLVLAYPNDIAPFTSAVCPHQLFLMQIRRHLTKRKN